MPLSKNISAIVWWSVSLVEEIAVPGENQQPVESQRQTLSSQIIFNNPNFVLCLLDISVPCSILYSVIIFDGLQYLYLK
jgi:hypothetical protein